MAAEGRCEIDNPFVEILAPHKLHFQVSLRNVRTLQHERARLVQALAHVTHLVGDVTEEEVQLLQPDRVFGGC